MRFSLLVILFVLGQLWVFGQANEKKVQMWKDSLKQKEIRLSIGKRMVILTALGNYYYDRVEYRTALSYYQEAINFPDAHKQVSAERWFNLVISVALCYRFEGQNEKAEKWFLTSLQLAENAEDNKKIYLKAYSNYFDFYHFQKRYKEAEKIGKKFIYLAHALKDSAQIGIANLMLARLYLDNQKTEHLAKEHFQKALQIVEAIKDSTNLIYVCDGLGSIYLNHKDYKNALRLFQKGSVISEKKRPFLVPYFKLQLAQVEMKQKKHAESFTHINQAIEDFKRANNQEGLIQALGVMVEFYHSQKKWEQAIQKSLELIDWCREHNHPRTKAIIIEDLIEIYEQTGQYREAFQFLKQHQAENDSIDVQGLAASRKMEQEVESQKNKLLMAEQQLKTERARKKSQLFLYIMTVVLLAGVVIVLTTRNRLLHAKSNMLIQREIAQRKAEELRAFNHSLGHDLKAPIDHIQIFLEKFTKHFENKLDDEGRNYLTRLSIITEDIKAMIRGMLLYAEHDQMSIQATEFETTKVVEELAQILKEANPSKKISFEISSLPNLRGDYLMLRQVFVNLMSNAIKYSSKQEFSLVKIYASQVNDQCEIHIRDNGIGFPEKTHDRMFELFKTVHDREKYTGTGIGLAIAKRIVTRHGGQVWAINNKQDRGATFILSFPC